MTSVIVVEKCWSGIKLYLTLRRCACLLIRLQTALKYPGHCWFISPSCGQQSGSEVWIYTFFKAAFFPNPVWFGYIQYCVNCSYFLHRCHPSFRCPAAPGAARPSGVCSPLEGDEEERRDAIWCCGGVCDLCLPDHTWAAHLPTPGQADTGTKSPGECFQCDLWHITSRLSRLFPSFSHGHLPSLQLILELCRSQPDAEVIAPHLERISAPAAASLSVVI